MEEVKLRARSCVTPPISIGLADPIAFNDYELIN